MDTFNPILDNFQGIRVIPDIHGEAIIFSKCVADAIKNDLFVVQLGDLIDYGPNSFECLKIAMNMMSNCQGVVLKSNHEDKLYRFCNGNNVEILAHPLSATLAQIDQIPSSGKLLEKFMGVYKNWPYWITWNNYTFVHAAFSPRMLKLKKPEDAHTPKEKKGLRTLALYGEVGNKLNENGLPIRTYGWIETLPKGHNVIVGHDVHSKEKPFIVERNNKSTVIFLDTGCGKGGSLSYQDILFCDNPFRD